MASTQPPGYVLVVDNRGSEHVQLTHLMVRSQQSTELAQKSLSKYVLAGQSLSVPLDLPLLAPDTTLRIEVRSDAAVALPGALVQVPRPEARPQ